MWVQHEDPAHRYRSNGRSKERADSVFPITPKNTAALTRWENLEAQRGGIVEEQNDIKKKLKTFLEVSEEAAE